MDIQTIGIVMVLGACLCTILYKTYLKCKAVQSNNIKEWLVYACTEAEKLLGSKTGKIKLRYVYNMFIEKYKFLAAIITFDQFSALVDAALIDMKVLIETNEAVKNLVEGGK